MIFDCYLAPVPRAHRAAYESLARLSASVAAEHGALRTVECWLDEQGLDASSYHAVSARLPDEAYRSIRAAAGARADETVVLSWIEWPDRATRDAGMAKLTADPRMQFDDRPPVFDGTRLVAAGFLPMLDSATDPAPPRSGVAGADEPLREDFAGPTLSPRLQWLHAPRRWQLDPAAPCLRLWPEAGTDYWQRTHYGFQADNGHLLHLQATGDFVLSTRVVTRPVHQYDQAGLMLRVSPSCWIKTSVEYEPGGPNRLGAVVTNGAWSDWSTQPLGQDVDTVWFRLRAEGCDVIVDSSLDGEHWTQLRMARLVERARVASVLCGLYACSPKAAGCEAAFSFLHFHPGRLV